MRYKVNHNATLWLIERCKKMKNFPDFKKKKKNNFFLISYRIKSNESKWSELRWYETD